MKPIKLKSLITEGLNYYHIQTPRGSYGGGRFSGTLGIVAATSKLEALKKLKIDPNPAGGRDYDIDLVSKSQASVIKKHLVLQATGYQTALKN